jgi:AcrR family transcriptional regulator
MFGSSLWIAKLDHLSLQVAVYGVYIMCVRRILMKSPNKSVSEKPATAGSILIAARELLDRSGLSAVAMRPVAKRVGITPMAIYRHFADRDSLLNAIANEAFDELAIQLQALHLKGDLERRLLQVATVFLNAAIKFPHLYELMFLAPREGAREYPKDFKSGRSPTFNPTVNIIEQAMRAGELRHDDPVEIAFELSALSHGLIMLYIGGRVAQREKQFRLLYRRSFRRYLNGLLS